MSFLKDDVVRKEGAHLQKVANQSRRTANVETTFHFDHLFGDMDTPADGVLNRGALGFDPFAALAKNGTVTVTSDDLENQLTKVEQNQLVDVYRGLGHVGEGHCRAEEI